MRILVSEYLCGRGFDASAASASLRAEGYAMLAAVVADLKRIPGVETVSLLHEDAPYQLPGEIRHIAADTEETTLRTLAAACDFSLVIAPEFAGLLLERCRWVEASGGRLLGPSSVAVAAASDKRTLTEQWARVGIPGPRPQTPGQFPAVLKPRFGAGAQATFLVRNDEELAAARDSALVEGWTDELVVQRFVPGTPASVTFLGQGDRSWALPAALQLLSDDGRFRYLGGVLPIPAPFAGRAERIARRGLSCLPPLHGYVGVDVVLGAADDGRDDHVIEVNARLTTSYVGLRELANFNLAEWMLRLARGEEAGALRWKTGVVEFKPSEPEASAKSFQTLR